MHVRNLASARLARRDVSLLAGRGVSWLAALGVVTALLLAPISAAADEAAPPAAAGHAAGMSEAERDRQAEAISRSVMSPFCPGRTVSSCPNAGPWRDDIRRWVGEGVDAAEIKRRLAERVPEHNLAGVPKTGLGWILPVALTLGAFGLLVFLLRYLVAPRPSEAKAGASAPAEEKAEAEADALAAAKPSASADGSAAPAAMKKPGKDWDAQLDRELDSLDN